MSRSRTDVRQARTRQGLEHLQLNKNIAAARGAWRTLPNATLRRYERGHTEKVRGATKRKTALCGVAMVFIMQNIVLINGKYFQRFHYMQAFYRWNGGAWDFISYRTHVLNVEPITIYEKHAYIVTAYEWHGATTQKQISRFIREFCGVSYYKVYKIARYNMRKCRGDSLRLVPSEEKGKFFCTIYGENTVKKDLYIEV